VTMPEASMNENYLFMSREHDIRIARQVMTMNPKPIPHMVNEGPHQVLRFGVPSLDATHDPTSLVGGEYIGHVIF
jgi:hypothetical protein